MIILKAIVFSTLIISLTSCTNFKQCPECFTPPESLNLKIQDLITGKDLLFTNVISTDSITIFYSKNNTDIIIEHEAYPDSANQKTILICYEISWKSTEGIKDFYLSFNDDNIENIFLDVQEKSDNCCTFFEWISFKINESSVRFDTTDYTHIYEINTADYASN